MNKKIFVGNLDYAVREEDLLPVFSEYGEVVSAKVISDFATGRSKGFAFIEMIDQEAALNAIQALNGQEILGRAMKVSEAKESNSRPNNRFSSGNRNGGGGNRNYDRNNRY